jgi:hypothetical protein
MTAHSPTGKRADEGVNRIKALGGALIANLVDQISQKR